MPLAIAATGPKMIRLAAQVADGVLLAVGAEAERLRVSIETIRATREAAGLSPTPVDHAGWRLVRKLQVTSGEPSIGHLR
ncbi:LLM class flavin-dependent oxidoreductase [Pseudonocardia sp.]|uniref:LLM class flavin-dependent oxidoreductase n=1 Tax=Pseudonocardia sp. TaxID=60912 RepID=UPI0031FBFC75